MSSMRIVLVLVLVACGGKATPPASTAPTSNAGAAASVFELGEITMLGGSDVFLKIHANGTTEVQSGNAAALKPGPTLKADGSIAIDGEVGARLDADGTLVALKDSNQKTGIHITDGALTLDTGDGSPGWKVTLADDGKLAMPADAHLPELRVTGADTAGKRRATLAVMSIVLMSGMAL